MITVRANERGLSWPPVNWADGSRMPLILDPGEGWFDDAGYLRFFSLEFPDGTVGNYKLLPKDQTTDTVIRLTRDFLLPFGLTIASNMILAGDTVIHNVAQELFERAGEYVIGDYLERTRIANSAYYNMAGGWQVIVGPLRANL